MLRKSKWNFDKTKREKEIKKIKAKIKENRETNDKQSNKWRNK